jgi:hypothetical protein
MLRTLARVVVSVFLLLPGFACSASAPAGPRVYIIEPADGAVITPSDGTPQGGTVHFRFGADNLRIEPSGTVSAGAGHLHLNLNSGCIPAGQIIPSDDLHRHFGKAEMEADILFTRTGKHTLCLQAANGAHTALPGDGMTHRIQITVNLPAQ